MMDCLPSPWGPVRPDIFWDRLEGVAQLLLQTAAGGAALSLGFRLVRSIEADGWRQAWLQAGEVWVLDFVVLGLRIERVGTSFAEGLTKLCRYYIYRIEGFLEQGSARNAHGLD